ncbi:hypothetical protein [Glycomyces dulcitolivorans]|jgi:hypothetical protein|uniref:hypothetical protein n=1 Tax=Glycomyces dulcitolivorans TaxID=2200759 RepID=UPI0013006DBC|nr:hypothetical protein [Glycomyces dulcitolivorans]
MAKEANKNKQKRPPVRFQLRAGRRSRRYKTAGGNNKPTRFRKPLTSVVIATHGIGHAPRVLWNLARAINWIAWILEFFE